MKQKCKAIALLFLAAIIAVSTLVGCVPDQSEYNYLFEYWLADWYGWYEITEATGKYAPLKGKKEACITQSTTSYRGTLQMHVYDEQGEYLFGLYGLYGHEAANEYGKVSLERINFDSAYVDTIPESKSERYDGIPLRFTVDGEAHGVAELAVCKGIAGEGEDTLTMEFYLRHWGVRWEDLASYTGDAFGGRAYAECLPPNYEAYVAIFEEEALRKQQEAYWHKKAYGWYGWYELSDGTGKMARYETAKTDCEVDISANHYWQYRLCRNYDMTLLPITEGEKDSTHKITIYGSLLPDPENVSGSIGVKSIRFDNTLYAAQGRAKSDLLEDSEQVILRAQAGDENGSITITVCLCPKDMPQDDLKALDGVRIDGVA